MAVYSARGFTAATPGAGGEAVATLWNPAADFVAASTPEPVTATTIDATRPAGAATGDVLIMVVQVFKTGITIASSGWSSQGEGEAGSGTPFTMAVLTKIDDGSAGPWTVSWDGTSQYALVAVVAYRATAVDDFEIAASVGASTTMRGPSATTTYANEMIVMAGASENAAAVTPPTGMSQRVMMADGLHISDVGQTAIGSTGNKDATLSPADANVGALITLRPLRTKRVALLELGVYKAGTTGARVHLVRCSTRGTPGSTITPSADSCWEAGDVAPSVAVLDLASYGTAEPATIEPRLFSMISSAVAGSEGSGMVWKPKLWIPPGTGLKIHTGAANVWPTSEVYAVWEEN